MTNPLLEKIKLPGKIYQLPSRGLFYKSDEINGTVQDAEVHIHGMTAIDEINLKNPDMLFSGKALEVVCKNCIPDINSPMEMLSRDVDAILLFLRIVSYGPSFEIEVTHTCKDAKKHPWRLKPPLNKSKRQSLAITQLLTAMLLKITVLSLESLFGS